MREPHSLWSWANWGVESFVAVKSFTGMVTSPNAMSPDQKARMTDLSH
jgi:hypothetical protein